MLRPPAEGSCVSGRFWKSMELMDQRDRHFRCEWNLVVGDRRRSPLDGAPLSLMMPMWPTQPTGKWLFWIWQSRWVSLWPRILNVLSQSTIWFWIKKGKVLIHAMPLVAKRQGSPLQYTAGLGHPAFPQSWNRAGSTELWDSLVSKTLSQGDDWRCQICLERPLPRHYLRSLWSWREIPRESTDLPDDRDQPDQPDSWFCNCVPINHKKRQASNGFLMAPCLTIQPFLSLPKWIQRRLLCQYDG